MSRLLLLAPLVAADLAFNVYRDILAYPQYEVVYSDSFIPESKAQSLLGRQKHGKIVAEDTGTDISREFDGRDPRDTYERIVFDSLPYLCTIPYVESVPQNATVATEEEQQQELARASDHGWQLLQGMQGNCLYYKAGWWMYSFCFNDGIKQFHPLVPGKAGVPIFPPQEDPNVESYVLGKFNVTQKESKEVSGELQTQGETKFLVQKFDDGTRCDLTGRPRRIEVQFHCNPTASDRINLTKEVAACVYLMVIHTTRLCGDVAFQPPQMEKPNPVTCQEIVPEDGVADWKKWKAETLNAQLVEQKDAAPKPLIIGGIEVGGKRLVGDTPERTIKPSKIILDGESDKFVATIAKSDGKNIFVLPEKEYDRLGLTSAKDKVEEYKKKIKQLAGNGVKWKLDVYATAQGLEFRMILGSDGSEEKESGEGSEEEYK